MKYEVQAYADRISTMNLQPDELESFELVKTMSADFWVEDATARELDGPTASVLKARAAQLAPHHGPGSPPGARAYVVAGFSAGRHAVGSAQESPGRTPARLTD